ncbi:85/88 kDa calcium-independent phospholipase A2-like [Ciona intestinalis]
MAYFLEKLTGLISDPYSVKQLPDMGEYQRSNMADSHGILALHKVNQYFDLVLFPESKASQRLIFRLFHLPLSKKKEAVSVFEKYKEKLLPILQSYEKDVSVSLISKLCNMIRNNNIRSPMHIVVEAGLSDVIVKEGPLNQWLNSQSCENHSTPLNLACELKLKLVVQKLIEAGAVLNKADDYGNNPFHIAVSMDLKEILQILCAVESAGAINTLNKEEMTPLHIACKAKKLHLCKILLQNKADPFIVGKIGLPIHYALKYSSNEIAELLLKDYPFLVTMQCAKHGGLPLHWCKSQDAVNLVLEYKSPVEVRSWAMHLPLHVMVLRGRLEAAVVLILADADVNGKGQNGNTALHLAVSGGHVMLVKMLLLFGASCLLENDFGETPGLLAMRSVKQNKDTIMDMLSCMGGLLHKSPMPSVNNNNATFQKRNSENFDQKLKVLCLDGGGVRGLVLSQILMAIERETGKQCRDLFDWISGTSTGGFLAMALVMGKSAIEAQRLYFRFKDKVFVGSRPYNSEPMEDFLKKEFGEDTTMESLQHGPRLLITAALADRKPIHLHLFRNYNLTDPISKSSKTKSFSKKLSDAEMKKLTCDATSSSKQLLWEAARSSGAAPTYFRPMGPYLDGGLVANNPTLDTLTEIHKYNKELVRTGAGEYKKIGLVLSIGTAQMKTTTARSLDLNWSSSPIALMNTALAGSELAQMMVDVCCQSNDYVVERAKAWCETMDASYFRLNPFMEDEVQLNETNDEILLNLLWDTQVYLQENKHLIEGIVALL